MKKKFLFLAFATLVACTDQFQGIEKTVVNDIPLNEAIQHLKSEMASNNNLYPGAKKNSKRSSLIKNADWKNVSYENLSAGKALLVPTKFDQKIYYQPTDGKGKLPIGSLTHLLFYKDKAKKMHMEVITLLPDYEKSSISSNKKFNGKILIENWRGDFVGGLSLKDGKTNPIILAEKTNGKADRTVCTTTNWFTCYSSEYGSDCFYNFTETICDVDWEENTYPLDGGGGNPPDNSGASSNSGSLNSSDYEGLAEEYKPAVIDDSQNKLCGSYKFTSTGDGLTAEIITLGANAIHRPSGEFIPVLWGSACLTFGSSTSLTNSADASQIFNAAWNVSMDEAEVWLNQQDKTPLTVELSNVIESRLIFNLGNKAGGAVFFSKGPCYGKSIVPSLTQYCN
jgi:hypothetical protein